MRRSFIVLALLAGLAIAARPASAQVPEGRWFLHAGVGPSFGTFGSTAAADASAGWRITNHLFVAGEFGMLPQTSFDKARSVAPSVSPVLPSSDVHVKAYHANANRFTTGVRFFVK